MYNDFRNLNGWWFDVWFSCCRYWWIKRLVLFKLLNVMLVENVGYGLCIWIVLVEYWMLICCFWGIVLFCEVLLILIRVLMNLICLFVVLVSLGRIILLVFCWRRVLSLMFLYFDFCINLKIVFVFLVCLKVCFNLCFCLSLYVELRFEVVIGLFWWVFCIFWFGVFIVVGVLDWNLVGVFVCCLGGLVGCWFFFIILLLFGCIVG